MAREPWRLPPSGEDPAWALRTWDEAKHPRDPGGEGGGQFIPKGGYTTGDPSQLAKLVADTSEVEGGTDYGGISKITGYRLPEQDQQVTWREPYGGNFDTAAFKYETGNGQWFLSRGRKPGWTTEKTGKTYSFRIKPEWARKPQRKGGYQPD
jgi:hypothetical protein